MILYGTKRILKINKSKKRIIISSLIGSLSTFLLFVKISNKLLLLLKLILSIIMILISFGLNNLKENTFYFYLISISIGGLIYLFDLKTNPYFNMIIILITSPIVILTLIKEHNNFKYNIKNKYIVNITYKNKEYKLEDFIDTGNR